jgi:glycosyltransferase involved in cell wall biosynthesis
MKIFNIIWSFSTGGIGKCFLTYDSLDNENLPVEVKSVCIDILNRDYDRNPLYKINATLVQIKHSFDGSWIPKLKDLIKTENPDLIFCHGFNGPVVVLIEKLLFGFKIPMVCSYHGLYHGPTPAKKLIAPFYNTVQTLIYKHFAQRVISVENYSRKYLIQKGVNSSKIVTVHNGISAENFGNRKVNLPHKKGHEITIGLASRMDSVKGIDYLIDSIVLVLERTNTPFKVYLVGEGPELDNLIFKVKQLSLEDVVLFVGYQDNIPEWLNSFDIFALPSLFEYHSIALLEAMRAGKAIVCTNVGGNTESIRDGVDGIVVPSKNPNEFSNALVKMLESEELRLTMGQSAQEHFYKEFTENIMKNNLIKALTL